MPGSLTKTRGAIVLRVPSGSFLAEGKAEHCEVAPSFPLPPPWASVAKTQMWAHLGSQPEGVTQGFSGRASVKSMFYYQPFPEKAEGSSVASACPWVRVRTGSHRVGQWEPPVSPHPHAAFY